MRHFSDYKETLRVSGAACVAGSNPAGPALLCLTCGLYSLCLTESRLQLLRFASQHAGGSYSDRDGHDRRANEQALNTGARLLSAYDTPAGRAWVITEADWSSTCVLLPSEYCMRCCKCGAEALA